MSRDMLGTIVRKLVTLPVEVHGVVADLLPRLEDPEWLTATKRFLRKEDPWPEVADDMSKEDGQSPPIPLFEKVSETSIRVFLKAPIPPPIKGARLEVWRADLPDSVLLERRDDGLYRDGRKVELYLAPGQKTGNVEGYELKSQLVGVETLHPNEGYALFQNPHLITDDRKPDPDEQGPTGFTFFWAAGYIVSIDVLYIRCLFRYNGEWRWDCARLDSHWDDQHPAACIGVK